MGNYEYAAIIGSGTIANIGHGLVHHFIDGAYPVPSQRDNLRVRRGEGVIIINPEDFSVSIGLIAQAISVGAAAVPLPVNPLEFRRALAIHNNGNITIFIGGSNVSTATGFPILAGEKIAIDIGNNPNVVVYAIASSNTEVRILEFA